MMYIIHSASLPYKDFPASCGGATLSFGCPFRHLSHVSQSQMAWICFGNLDRALTKQDLDQPSARIFLRGLWGMVSGFPRVFPVKCCCKEISGVQNRFITSNTWSFLRQHCALLLCGSHAGMNAGARARAAGGRRVPSRGLVARLRATSCWMWRSRAHGLC